jgi:iron-sulfur cluster assembly protein
MTGVTLTPSAAKHVAAHIAKRGKGIGLRLGVRTTGCSGLAYKLEYADEALPEDLQFESHGVKVVVDPKSLPYLAGTELTSPAKASTKASSSTTERQGRLRLRRVVHSLKEKNNEIKRTQPARRNGQEDRSRRGECRSHARLRRCRNRRHHHQ